MGKMRNESAGRMVASITTLKNSQLKRVRRKLYSSLITKGLPKV